MKSLASLLMLLALAGGVVSCGGSGRNSQEQAAWTQAKQFAHEFVAPLAANLGPEKAHTAEEDLTKQRYATIRAQEGFSVGGG